MVIKCIVVVIIKNIGLYFFPVGVLIVHSTYLLHEIFIHLVIESVRDKLIYIRSQQQDQKSLSKVQINQSWDAQLEVLWVPKSQVVHRLNERSLMMIITVFLPVLPLAMLTVTSQVANSAKSWMCRISTSCQCLSQ